MPRSTPKSLSSWKPIGSRQRQMRTFWCRRFTAPSGLPPKNPRWWRWPSGEPTMANAEVSSTLWVSYQTRNGLCSWNAPNAQSGRLPCIAFVGDSSAILSVPPGKALAFPIQLIANDPEYRFANAGHEQSKQEIKYQQGKCPDQNCWAFAHYSCSEFADLHSMTGIVVVETSPLHQVLATGYSFQVSWCNRISRLAATPSACGDLGSKSVLLKYFFIWLVDRFAQECSARHSSGPSVYVITSQLTQVSRTLTIRGPLRWVSDFGESARTQSVRPTIKGVLRWREPYVRQVSP